jgi:hypothetical protein
MTFKENLTAGISFILYGLLSLLSYFRILHLPVYEILGIVLGLYGILTVHQSFGNDKRLSLILGVIVFLTGVIFAVKSNYGIINDFSFVLTSVLFIGGALFLILFIDNTKTTPFLYSGVFLLSLGILSAFYLREVSYTVIVSKGAELFNSYWPALLILLGISLFANRAGDGG